MENSRSTPPDETERAREELRARVEEKYDFDDFGPAEMAEMTAEEWDAAFDPDTWITGPELLDRVEADLKRRVADRDVFALVERQRTEAGNGVLVAYSDEGYAVVYEDGSVEGRGTVLRDVKPTVALASMEEYEVPEPPEGELLPDPAEVTEGSGDLANVLIQAVAAVHLLAGVVLLGAAVLGRVSGQGLVVAAIAGLLFLAFGAFLLFVVANARLSDRFRAEQYRNRLRALDLDGALAEEDDEGVEAGVDDER